MEISFSKNKDCDAFNGLMEDPTNRVAQKRFSKVFNQSILQSSVKVYQKLKSSQNASVYNQLNGGQNKIEKATGVKKNEPIILKVRIQSDYRKFFHFYETSTSTGVEDFCVTDNWTGFDKVSKIYIFAVNKHDYSVV